MNSTLDVGLTYISLNEILIDFVKNYLETKLPVHFTQSYNTTSRIDLFIKGKYLKPYNGWFSVDGQYMVANAACSEPMYFIPTKKAIKYYTNRFIKAL